LMAACPILFPAAVYPLRKRHSAGAVVSVLTLS
jgi:hypothetical protein